MQTKHEFRISNARLAIHLSLALWGVLFFGYLSLSFSTKMVKALLFTFPQHNIAEVVFYIGLVIMGTLMLSILVFMTVAFALMIRVYLRLFSLTFAVSSEGIEIISKAGKCFVSKSDIIHVFSNKTGITMVWKPNEVIMTFFITKKLFGGKPIQDVNRLFNQYDIYTDNKQQIKQIRKKLKLDNIFRKNRFEFQLGKLSKPVR
jgi:hypothetical protein